MSARSKPTDQRQLEDVRFTTADYLAAISHGLSPIEWHDRGRPKVAGIAAAHGAGDKPPLGTSLRPWGVYRSKLEWRYAKYIDSLVGRVATWEYEPETLDLGGARYTPDFRVDWLDGSTTWDEVKGYSRRYDRLTLRIAAARFPLRTFRRVEWKQGTWKITTIPRPHG